MLHADLKKKKKSDHVNRTNVSTTSMEPFKKHYLQHGKGRLRDRANLSFNKTKRETERHGETTRRGAGPQGGVGRGGYDIGMYDMCVCAKPLQVSRQKA